MKNIQKWKPSKYVYKNGKLRASKNKKELGVSSRLIADLVAEFYDSKLQKYARGDLVDLGCGKVPLYEAYKDKISKCICVDWDNPFHENEFLDMNVDLNKNLPFENNVFDTIILSDVLEHIQDPILLWNEMNRILRKDGILIMNVPFHYWIHDSPFDYYRYTRYALEYFANKSNFQIISIDELGGVVEILTDFISKIISKIPLIGKFLAMSIQWCNLQFLKLKIGKKLKTETSKHFVLSYGLVAKKIN